MWQQHYKTTLIRTQKITCSSSGFLYRNVTLLLCDQCHADKQETRHQRQWLVSRLTTCPHLSDLLLVLYETIGLTAPPFLKNVSKRHNLWTLSFLMNLTYNVVNATKDGFNVPFTTESTHLWRCLLVWKCFFECGWNKSCWENYESPKVKW